MDLVISRPEGLYCPAGDFYIDPWRPVERAVITHAHGDHARVGSQHYLAAAPGETILRARLGQDINLQTLRYGERLLHQGVFLSFHPAGHLLGSAQIRLEYGGEVWVASGDYKIEPDGTCAPFEPVRCDTFITESTFGLPIYRWQPQAQVFAEINQWWQANSAVEKTSVLFCYSLGKAQRILHGIDARIGPLLVHGAMEPINRIYREAGVYLPLTINAAEIKKNDPMMRKALVLAPPSAANSSWMHRVGDYSDGFASGWMRVRGTRRRRGVDRGFVLSDHADWPGLLWAIEQSGAQRIMVTHGSAGTLVRYLREQGFDAMAFDTQFGHDEEDVVIAAAEPAEMLP
ncbi:ligase-associated DNA damage response exonuclease [Pseudomonas sp. P5_109]|uniref:ligase-associated DNA damage response exonuclease n=1 Tax=unclassified Pseudomonas TaxID=196821 RepID=UPI001CBB6B4E|nr:MULTISPECIES: ligase-associated DNA damage response exonuclease [unclassified Pseudomonas]WPN31352.1 ligase-associated DNA damage response exonuclease [Pseudomonas sp. P5_109]